VTALAVDAGQTEIRTALGDGLTASAPGVQRMDAANVGPDAVAAALLAAVAALGPLAEPPESVGVGLSGFEAAGEGDLRKVEHALRRSVGASRIAIASDGVTALLGALGDRPGAVVAAGTGTIVVARGAHGWAKVDGWGSLLGDDGSGFAIGRAGLQAALREIDGRGGSKALLQAAEARFGEAERMSETVHRSEVPTRTVASFALDVARVAEGGDETAIAILADAARELAISACAALAQVFPPGEQAAVSWAGNVFRAGALLRDPFQRELRARRPAVEVVEPAADALAGAALLAERAEALPFDARLLWRAA
jgi:N-acetylglucosamine kinase-like BadF-type ATPase